MSVHDYGWSYVSGLMAGLGVPDGLGPANGPHADAAHAVDAPVDGERRQRGYQPEPMLFGDLCGLALRDNPKRAQLIVSKVLGKHIPAPAPDVGIAARRLASRVLLAEYDAAPDGFGGGHRRVVFSFAETATLMGDLVAASLTGLQGTELPPSQYMPGTSPIARNLFLEPDACLHSTRYPDPGRGYERFEESHSHASTHLIAESDYADMADADELVLIDDEISTGNTIRHMLDGLRGSPSWRRKRLIVVAAYVDGTGDPDGYAAGLVRDGYADSARVVSLTSRRFTVDATARDALRARALELRGSERVDRADPDAPLPAPGADYRLSRLTISPDTVDRLYGGTDPTGRVTYSVHGSGSTSERRAADILKYASVESLIKPILSHHRDGATLVVCLEEARGMDLLAAAISLHWYHDADDSMSVSSTTKSPVVSLDDPGYAIRSKLEYTTVRDGGTRYLYNTKGWRRILIVDPYAAGDATAPTDGHDAGSPAIETGLVAALLRQNPGADIEYMLVDDRRPKTQSGPEFGSYPRRDVEWLMKPLGETETRRLADAGSTAAADVLDEYLPADDSMYESAMDSNADTVAGDVIRLADQVMRDAVPSGHADDDRIVIASIARAGVPAGILLKHTLERRYHMRVDHYAVGMARGNGIDPNARRRVHELARGARVVFVDGWTGKGSIAAELADDEEVPAAERGLYVIADPCGKASGFGGTGDYLMPYAALNSTCCGLVSRTIADDRATGPDDYYAAMNYTDETRTGRDRSNEFIRDVKRRIDAMLTDGHPKPGEATDAFLTRMRTEHGIDDTNRIKAGVAETIRMLLLNHAQKVIINDAHDDGRTRHDLDTIRDLAADRGVAVATDTEMPYTAIGISEPPARPHLGNGNGRA